MNSNTIKLRATSEADLDFVLAAEYDPENTPYIGTWTRDEHRAAFSDKNLAHLIIATLADDKPVGYVILQGLQDPNESIELKRIAITAKGQGYGHQSLRLIKQLAFEELNAHRLWLDFKDFNVRGRHLYSSEGFVLEGTLRECLKVNDKFETLVVMSILKSEYEAARVQ